MPKFPFFINFFVYLEIYKRKKKKKKKMAVFIEGTMAS